jgi:hypothetical protein
MSLGSVLVLLLLATGTACGIGIVYYREVIIDELELRAPDALPRFPRASWSFFELMRLHKQYCPESRTRAAIRTLTLLALSSMMGIFVLGFISLISKLPLP